MVGISSFLGGGSGDASFDRFDEFVPEHLPDPGPFLADRRILADRAHAAFHRVTREVFEARGVYDMTFGYNLAKLNLDTRHPDAGYRYAEADDDVLRAEFTPTTPFCPQSTTLAVGSFRAWNGLSDRHEYDIVRVRVHPMHHNADSTNERLRELEQEYRETGTVPEEPDAEGRRIPESEGVDNAITDSDESGTGPQSPF